MLTLVCRFFFVTALSSVKIFSRVTGQLVSTLSSTQSTSTQTSWSGRLICESHTAAITGIAINPYNSLQLLTSSLDGTIKVWDYLDATLLRTIDLEFPISHMIAHASVKGSVYVALMKPKSGGASGSNTVDPIFFSGRCNSIIQLVSLSTVSTRGNGATKSQNVTRVGKARQTTAMALSPDAKYLVLIGKRKLHIANTAALKDGFTKVISDQVLTCLAFHPENNTFATGDAIGQIRLWYFLDDNITSNKPIKGLRVAPSVLLHWHAHAVSALTYSPNGANLLSGGEESVMVLWQLASQNREYVPRLGGSSIESLAVLESKQGQEEEYIAALADGSIAFISSINLKPNRIISQVLIDSSRQLVGKDYLSELSFPLAIQPKTRHLVMNAGHASSLQFYDVQADRLVSQMEVLPSNRVSRPDEVPLEPSRVDRVCFSSSGDWMATIESRGMAELALKVWKWDTRSKTYTLNSRIEEPHKGGRVTSMSFSPDLKSNSAASPLLVTTGADHQIRTWRKVEQQVKGARREEFWIMRSTFNYRQLPVTEACWEPNGSLLAISHDSCVTLWEPHSNSLQQVIPTTGISKGLIFTGKGGRYVVALSDRSVVVWDVVFCRASWEKEVEADFLIPQGEDKFCLLSRQRNWTIATSYLPQNSDIQSQSQLALSLRQVCSDSSPESTPCFFALTSDYDVVRVGYASNQEAPLTGHTPQSLRGVTVKRRTLYDELIGPRAELDETKPIQSASRSIASQSQVGGDLFDVASHLLPPISALCGPMLQGMLPKRQETTKKQEDKQIMYEEIDGGQILEEKTEQTSSGLNRLRAVSQMDFTGLSEVFAKQASISDAAPVQNGVKSTKINGTKMSSIDASSIAASTTNTPTKAKASPKKVISNGHAATPSKAISTESPSNTPKSVGRKRKQLVD
jgi:NET1-associated nuclear protein 1 (U3 small nucleolar RNA-associated protein 17)